MKVIVHDGNIDHAIKALKQKCSRQGIFREEKEHRHFEKPSERRRRKREASIRRAQRSKLRKAQRELELPKSPKPKKPAKPKVQWGYRT